uniref:Uncharacterized protein n=1 Tax=viral metagenome TaxID=1070528 RepID=A0A6C0EXU3_9ZZZZ
MKFSFTKKNILIISIIIIAIVLAITLPLVLLKKSSSNSSSITGSTIIPYNNKISNIKYYFALSVTGSLVLGLTWDAPTNQEADSLITSYSIWNGDSNALSNGFTEIFLKSEFNLPNYQTTDIPLGVVYNLKIVGNNSKNYDYSSDIKIDTTNIGQWYDSNNNKINIDTNTGADNLSIRQSSDSANTMLWSYDDNSNPIYFFQNLDPNKYSLEILKNISKPPYFLNSGNRYKINQIIDANTNIVLYTYKL